MAYSPAVRSTVNADNSTTTPLGPTVTYIGTWADVEVWNSISVLISGTAVGAANGTLTMQFSHDGATVARAITVNVADVADASPRTLGTIARYFRVRYDNGAKAQTTFSLQTMFHSSQVNLVSRLDQDLTGMDDVQGATVARATDTYSFTQEDIERGYLALSFPTRLDGFRVQYTNGASNQGSFFIQADLRTNSSPLRTDQSGALITGDFQLEVALGNIPNHSNGTKFGSALSIDGSDVPVTVWRPADGNRRTGAFSHKVFATVAQNVWVASTDNADTAEITLVLNDASNDLVEVAVTLTGNTPVDTGVSALDCNTAFVSGADQTLAGDVWVMRSNNFGAGAPAGEPSAGSEADTLAFIPSGDQRTQQAVYRVPANTTMVVREVHAASAISTGNGRTSLKMRVKPDGGSWYTLRPYIMSTNFVLERPEVMTFAAGTFVEFFIDEASNGTDTTVIFNYDLIREA